MKICIVVPAYNEEKRIGALVEELVSKKYDVIVVDDGSTDACGQIAEDKGASVVRNATRGGKGYSLRAGFKYALQKDYAGILTMDGDGQHAVSDIENFCREAQKHGPCIVAGNRMTQVQDMPRVRFWTNRFMSSLISWACKQNIPDTQCGFRYISAEVLRRINLTCDGFQIETEILMKASKKNFKVFSTPIKTIYRDEKSKIRPVKDTIRFFGYFVKELFAR